MKLRTWNKTEYWESADKVICDACGSEVLKTDIVIHDKIKSNIFKEEYIDVCKDCYKSWIKYGLCHSVRKTVEKKNVILNDTGIIPINKAVKYSTKLYNLKIDFKFTITNDYYDNGFIINYHFKTSKKNDDRLYESRESFLLKKIEILEDLLKPIYEILTDKEYHKAQEFFSTEYVSKKQKKKSKKKRKEEEEKKYIKVNKWYKNDLLIGECCKKCKKCADHFCKKNYRKETVKLERSKSDSTIE